MRGFETVGRLTTRRSRQFLVSHLSFGTERWIWRARWALGAFICVFYVGLNKQLHWKRFRVDCSSATVAFFVFSVKAFGVWCGMAAVEKGSSFQLSSKSGVPSRRRDVILDSRLTEMEEEPLVVPISAVKED